MLVVLRCSCIVSLNIKIDTHVVVQHRSTQLLAVTNH